MSAFFTSLRLTHKYSEQDEKLKLFSKYRRQILEPIRNRLGWRYADKKHITSSILGGVRERGEKGYHPKKKALLEIPVATILERKSEETSIGLTIDRMSKTDFESVFDLPRLNTHPSAEELISTLDYLALEPPSWDQQIRNNELEGGRKTKFNEIGVPSYLTSIVGSLLSWIHEDRREEIWEAAGKRLSERCGRTGELLALCSLQQELLPLILLC